MSGRVWQKMSLSLGEFEEEMEASQPVELTSVGYGKYFVLFISTQRDLFVNRTVQVANFINKQVANHLTLRVQPSEESKSCRPK